MPVVCKVCRQSSNEAALRNSAFVDETSFKTLAGEADENALVSTTTGRVVAVRCVVGTMPNVLNVECEKELPRGSVLLTVAQRSIARLALDAHTTILPLKLGSVPLVALTATTIHCLVNPIAQLKCPITVKDTQLMHFCKSTFNGMVLARGQYHLVPIKDVNDSTNIAYAYCTFTQIDHVEVGVSHWQGQQVPPDLGYVDPETTEFVFEGQGDGFNLQITMGSRRNLFKTDFNFEQLGIGGLDKEFADIFRRAFASRIFPPHVVQELGITHVRGMLLHGPPGTGKTLIARQIGKALNAKEPKIVNGPEILNKFVGQSEENIRKLFAEAEADEKKFKEKSPLHIIIFDEIDAICKQRGSNPSGAGVNDSIVNQLLSKIDGVEALNNILLIGMTNRMDMLDEALLRPGRLEVHIEIGLPDEAGRVQIFKIHTKSMRDAERLDSDVSLETLAKRTRNFSGAEIAGLIRSAVSYAFARNVDASSLKAPANDDVIRVCQADFEQAMDEVKPAFGVAEDALRKYIINGIVPFSDSVEKLSNDLMTLSTQVRDSTTSPLVSLLLWGSPGSGKTAMACHIAERSGFPFIKIISPNDYIGYTELGKAAAITRCFEDAYKSDISMIILDDLERLLDYASLGPRFSNLLLQTLMVLVKRMPTKQGRRIMIIGTTSKANFIQDSELLEAFQLHYHSPLIKSAESLMKILRHRNSQYNDITTQEAEKLAQSIYIGGSTSVKLPVKALYLAIEMAKEITKNSGGENIDHKTLLTCLRDYGIQDI